MPSFGRFSAIAEQTHCKSNVKQLASLFSVYCEDYNGYFPYGVGTLDFVSNQIPTTSLSPQELLYDYTSGHKEVYTCPTDPSPENYWWWRYQGHPNGITASSYMFCENGLYGNAASWRAGQPISVYNILTPRTYVYMTDGRCCPNGWTWRNIDENYGSPRIDWNHSEYLNLLYGDLHVEDKWIYDDLAGMRKRADQL